MNDKIIVSKCEDNDNHIKCFDKLLNTKRGTHFLSILQWRRKTQGSFTPSMTLLGLVLTFFAFLLAKCGNTVFVVDNV